MNLKWILMCMVSLQMATACKASVACSADDQLRVENATANEHQYIVMKALPGDVIETSSHMAPDQSDSTILLSVAAAFTGDDLYTICGDQVVKGERLPGYDDVTTTGHMLVVDNKVSMHSQKDLVSSMEEAKAKKGYLFQQCYIVENGVGHVERIPQALLDRNPHIIYRAACVMKDGSFAVIQGGDKQYCDEFIKGLVALGAQNAMYLDMGTWAWGWYRTHAGGEITELAEHFDNTRYQSNWLIVRAGK